MPTRLVVAAEEVSLRLRVTWDSHPTYQQWQGTVSLPGGQISNPAPLGIEADEPGSMWIESGQLVVRQASPRVYDAVDIDVAGPADAELKIQLTAANASPAPMGSSQPTTLTESIRLGDLIDAPWQVSPDDRPYRLDVRRAAGDELRVKLERSHLVFAPGEKLHLEVQPHLLSVEDGTPIRFDLEMRAARSQRGALWSTRVDRNGGDVVDPIDVDVEVPATEGAYEIAVVASQHRFAQRFGAVTLAERTVQFVVIDDRPHADVDNSSEQEWDVVDQLDPSSSAWWKRLNASLLSRSRKTHLSSGHARIVEYAERTVMELPAVGDDGEPRWEAFRLAVRRPGWPHIVEVEYPHGAKQTLGISVVEPNAAGEVVPIGLDSGVYSDGDSFDTQGEWETHRLVFWPKTKSPMVLLTNGDKDRPARVGRIRLLGGVEHLPVRSPLEPIASERLLAGYMARPLVCENFSAPETVDPNTGRSLKDWVTFLDAGKRLIEYLRYAGYNGLSVAVAADGSTIYPSSVLQATPRYDNGVFFSTGQDVVRKDVLEMLFRLFDREGMKLVPVVQFSSRLPALEARLRSVGGSSNSLLLRRADGRSWLEVHGAPQAQAPYYNPLDPDVQTAMTDVVGELGDRYGRHFSFAGAGVELAADSYSVLPGAQWGLDAETFARFTAETGLAVGGQAKSSVTADNVLSEHPQAWLNWRARTIANMYAGMSDRIQQTNPSAKLYLGGTRLFANEHLQQQLQPTLTRTQRHADVLAELGLVPSAFAHQGVVLLRPHWLSPDRSAGFRSAYVAANESEEMDDAFAHGSSSAALFYHPPQLQRLKSFEAESPFDSTTLVWQVTQASPSGSLSRRAFVHQLATTDTTAVLSGGWLLPIGQDDALVDVYSVYTQLPAADFEDVPDSQSLTMDEHAAESVTVRRLSHEGRTYVYLVNDAPWSVTTTLQIQAPAGCKAQSLSRPEYTPQLTSASQTNTWLVPLRPYDLVGVVFDAPNVTVTGTTVTYDEEVAGQLETRLGELEARMAVLGDPSPVEWLENPGFELPADSSGAIPGWETSPGDSVTAKLISRSPYEGNQCLRLSNRSGTGWIASATNAELRTGRLYVQMSLRSADANQAPRVQIAVEATHDGQLYRRVSQAQTVTPDWKVPYAFAIPSRPSTPGIPLDGLTNVRVRLEIVGPGVVDVDDVRVFDLQFKPDELTGLRKQLIWPTRHLHHEGQYAECNRILDSYWAEFLEDNVPLPANRIALEPSATRAPINTAPALEPPTPESIMDPAADEEKESGFINSVKRFFNWRF